MKVLIQAAKLISPNHPFHQKVVDILIEDGKIKKIDSQIDSEADQTLHQEGLHVSEGWFDSSVSFGEPGYEERETLANGMRTAGLSGFTAIALNPDNHPVTDSQGAVLFLKNMTATYPTQVFPLGSLTQQGEGVDLSEMYDMSRAGAVAFGDYKKPVKNPNLLKIALQYNQSFGGLVQSFPNMESLTKYAVVHEGEVSIKMGVKGYPAFVEELQVNRDLEILEYTGGKLHIPTISTAGSLERIKEAKKKGLDVSCSVALHNLFYTDEKLLDFDSSFKVMPPLRDEQHRKALVEGLKNGDIDMVTTDHRPLNIELKKLEFELATDGSLGLESAFGVLNQLFGTEKAIEILTRGRERFGIDKPEIKEGMPAELTLFLPNEEYEFAASDILSTSKNTMYLGAKLKGKVLGVFSNNQLMIKEA